MDSFEWNKIAGAVIATIMIVLGLNIVSDMVFAPKKPVVAGYDLPMPQTQTAQAPAAQQTPSEPLPVVLARADVTKGQAAARKCASCHSFEKGGPNRIGPNLWNIIGNTKGHAQGFGYSAALKERIAKGEKWGFEEIYEFVKNPRGYLPGTSMSFAGITSSQERADLIAYLQTLSDNPVPLPKP